VQLSIDITYTQATVVPLSARFSVTRQRSHITVLFGPSGAGKSLLLYAIAGLIRPTAGVIHQGETCWFNAQKQIHLTPQKRKIGILFQDYSLFPHLTVSENIAYGFPSETLSAAEVSDWLTRFQLDGLADRMPHQLSGGERQRVALAQTLAPKPLLVLLDEPFSALDRPLRKTLLREVQKWLPSQGMSAIIVLHDLDDAICMGEELVVLAGGKVLQQGRPEAVIGHPDSAQVAEILDAENLFPANVLSAQEGEIVLDVGGQGVYGIGEAQVGDPCYILIRAEDIFLEQDAFLDEAEGYGAGTSVCSARNHLRGRIVEAIPSGPQVSIRIDCGFILTAKITKGSADRLDLFPGAVITAVIKASSIHFIPR
jgi:molybdopterin-binding protein